MKKVVWVYLMPAKGLYVEDRLAAIGEVAKCICMVYGLRSGSGGVLELVPGSDLSCSVSDYSSYVLVSLYVYFTHLTNIY